MISQSQFLVWQECDSHCHCIRLLGYLYDVVHVISDSLTNLGAVTGPLIWNSYLRTNESGSFPKREATLKGSDCSLLVVYCIPILMWVWGLCPRLSRKVSPLAPVSGFLQHHIWTEDVLQESSVRVPGVPDYHTWCLLTAGLEGGCHRTRSDSYNARGALLETRALLAFWADKVVIFRTLGTFHSMTKVSEHSFNFVFFLESVSGCGGTKLTFVINN